MGVLREYEDGFVGYNDQRMAALLAGGIYQTRAMVDAHDQRIEKLELQLAERDAIIEELKEQNDQQT